MSKAAIVQTIVGGILLLAVLACLVVLALKGIVTGGQVMGIIGIIVGGALGILGVHIGATSTANTASALGVARSADLMTLYNRGIIPPPEPPAATTRTRA